MLVVAERNISISNSCSFAGGCNKQGGFSILAWLEKVLCFSVCSGKVKKGGRVEHIGTSATDYHITTPSSMAAALEGQDTLRNPMAAAAETHTNKQTRKTSKQVQQCHCVLQRSQMKSYLQKYSRRTLCLAKVNRELFGTRTAKCQY
jgi:hypothetical protein